MMTTPFIINDSTPEWMFQPPESHNAGLDLSQRFADVNGFAYNGVAEPFNPAMEIPESEWQARIQERVELKNAIPDFCDRAGLPSKDQSNTNYCWINAPVYTIEVTRLLQNQSMVILSPASAGAPIKNFRNVGGWGKEGLEHLAEHGAVPQNLWPANAIDRKYYTPENIEIAKDYRVLEWIEAQPRNKKQLVSLLLRNIPVAVGYNWWRHEVTAVDVQWKDGEVVLVIRNSWGNWGDRGYGILQGSRMLPDDAVAPRSVIAS